MVGSSRAIAAVRASAEQVAPGDAKVLITGESGVGKDVLARYIHSRSARAAKPFVAVNCAGFTDTLLESELFGHVKGAFTGAYRDKLGKLKLAHEGTIFLDEVGEMSVRMQALLLRFLESGEIHQVGADVPSARVNVRIIAATNRSLPELIRRGAFREDLYYRINVVQIHMPPLRERPEDIEPLVAHFAVRHRPLHFSEAARQALLQYHWPGNVRELQNVIEQISWMTTGDVVTPEDLPSGLRTTEAPTIRERRRQVADALYEELVAGRASFWDSVHPRFLRRDITRQDVRSLVQRGLAATSGSYKRLLTAFGIKQDDYKRFMNFLATHDCVVDYRAFRTDAADMAERPFDQP
jgi:transcriptional regulator with PAS, ATPase and Fis domain